MTNMILSVIGIVLAALAALVAVDYSGEYYHVGYARAQASTLSNAGANVVAGYTSFEVRNGHPPHDFSELSSSGAGRGILSSMPALSGVGTADPAWAVLAHDSGSERAFVISGIRDDVCLSVNDRLSGVPVESGIPTEPTAHEGCFSRNGVNTYYAFLGTREG